jgi:hypothetical protein
LTDEDQELLKAAKLRLWSYKGPVEVCEDSWLTFLGAHKWKGRWMGYNSLDKITRDSIEAAGRPKTS